MNLDKELARISDWLVIEINHERYGFETVIKTYTTCSLQEVCEGLMIPREELEKYLEKPFPDEHNYNYDRCVRNPIDTRYSFPYLEGLPLKDIHLDVIHIVDMHNLNKEGYASFIWGSTDKKFGLIDIDREALEAAAASI